MIVLLREREACELSPDCGIVTRCPPLRQAQAPTRDSSAGGVPKQEPECVRKHRGSENVITIKDWDALRPVHRANSGWKERGARLLAIPHGLEGVKNEWPYPAGAGRSRRDPPARTPLFAYVILATFALR